MAKKTIHLRTNLIGLRKNFWHKNLSGWFAIGGRDLTDLEARKMIEYALEHGIEYDCDVDVDEIKKLLGWED